MLRSIYGGAHFTFDNEVPGCRFQGLDHSIPVSINAATQQSDTPGFVKLGAVERRLEKKEKEKRKTNVSGRPHEIEVSTQESPATHGASRFGPQVSTLRSSVMKVVHQRGTGAGMTKEKSEGMRQKKQLWRRCQTRLLQVH